MPRANLDLHGSGLEIALDRVGHGLREALLQPRHAGQLAHQSRDGADAADAVGGHEAHRDRAEVGNQMMGAHAVERDLFQPHVLAGVAAIARGPDRGRLAPQRGRALGQEIGGELGRDRVLGIAPGIDPQ